MAAATASAKTLKAVGYALLYGYGITALQAPNYADDIETAMQSGNGDMTKNVADAFQEKLSFYTPADSLHAAVLFVREYNK